MNLTDSHAHLQMELFDSDREETIRRFQSLGETRLINIALGPEKEKLEAGLQIAQTHEKIWATLGVHPHDADKMTTETLRILEDLARDPKVVAIGEIGLDYFYEHSPKDTQKERFRDLLELALRLGKPVTIHSRDAFDDTFSVLRELALFEKVGGVLHCFTGSAEEAQQYLKLGAYISFSGILTFKKAMALKEAARIVPLERMLIETDSPYLAPEPHRGKRNEPAYVMEVARAIGEIKKLATETVAQVTSDNAARLFNLN